MYARYSSRGVETPNTTLGSKGSRILSELKKAYPSIERRPDPPHATAMHYQVPGHSGDIGIIAAFSRTFCGTCNRIRVTAQGELKTCLYDHGVLNLRNVIRSGAGDEALRSALLDAFAHRPKDGFEAEANRTHPDLVESMSTIGGSEITLRWITCF